MISPISERNWTAAFFRRQRRFADHCSWWSWDHKQDQSQKIHNPEVEIILLETKVQVFVKTRNLRVFIASGGNNGIQGWWKQVTIRLQKSQQKRHSLKLLYQGFTQSGAIPVQLSLMNVHQVISRVPGARINIMKTHGLHGKRLQSPQSPPEKKTAGLTQWETNKAGLENRHFHIVNTSSNGPCSIFTILVFFGGKPGGFSRNCVFGCRCFWRKLWVFLTQTTLSFHQLFQLQGTGCGPSSNSRWARIFETVVFDGMGSMRNIFPGKIWTSFDFDLELLLLDDICYPPR